MIDYRRRQKRALAIAMVTGEIWAGAYEFALELVEQRGYSGKMAEGMAKLALSELHIPRVCAVCGGARRMGRECENGCTAGYLSDEGRAKILGRCRGKRMTRQGFERDYRTDYTDVLNRLAAIAEDTLKNSKHGAHGWFMGVRDECLAISGRYVAGFGGGKCEENEGEEYLMEPTFPDDMHIVPDNDDPKNDGIGRHYTCKINGKDAAVRTDGGKYGIIVTCQPWIKKYIGMPKGKFKKLPEVTDFEGFPLRPERQVPLVMPEELDRSEGRGVSFSRYHQKWSARHQANGERKWLGMFDTRAEAESAYIQAKENRNSDCDEWWDEKNLPGTVSEVTGGDNRGTK